MKKQEFKLKDMINNTEITVKFNEVNELKELVTK